MNCNRELRLLIALLCLFLLVNALTLSRYPAVWVGDVWLARDATQFGAERSCNLILFAAFLVLVWRWMRTSEVVPSPGWRLAAVALLICGHAMVLSYRSGRYDTTGMLLAALVLNAWRGRRWLIPLGVLLPFAGLQLLPATLVLGTLAAFFGGPPAWVRSATLAGSAAFGTLLLRAFYGHFGVWEGFRASTAAIGLIGQSMLVKLEALPAAYLMDKSRFVASLALLLLLWTGRKSMDFPARRIAGFALGALLFLPTALHLTGKFPIHYGWMVFLPLVVAIAHLAARIPQARTAVAVLLTLSALAGLPLRLTVEPEQSLSARGPSATQPAAGQQTEPNAENHSTAPHLR